jgi:hypothetical protein
MTSKRQAFAIVVVISLFLFVGPLHADCLNPAGPEGQTIYNGDYHTLQFCNGTNWVAMGATSGASETDPKVGTLTPGKWCSANGGGTAIVCTNNAPPWTVAGSDVYYSTGSVAVGTSLPTTALTVTGTTTSTNFVGNGSGLTNLNASNIASGTVNTARLGTGTADSTTYLRGDQTWASAGGGGAYQAFTSSGTWTKPAGTAPYQMVIVEMWGGGGGGGANSQGGGGGGGAYNKLTLKAGDLGATESVSVGAGGAVNSAGGDSSFGSWGYAYGGGGGANCSRAGGGSGGGILSAGTTSTSCGSGSPTTAGGSGGTLGGGGTGATGYGGAGGSGIYGGGGGGGGSDGNAGPGGASDYGGAGGRAGGGGSSTTTSIYGGAGGNSGVAGSVPGGGGGRNAVGARGEVRVWVVN